MKKRIVEIKIYSFSLLLSEAFLSVMAAFWYAVNRILLKYGEDIDLSENEKKTHALQFYGNGLLQGKNSTWYSYVSLRMD